MEIYSRGIIEFDKYMALQRAQARNSSLSALSGAITNYQLGAISRSLDGLAVLVGWGMGEIILRLEMNQETLNDIREKIQSPLDTQAKELRRRAEYAYENEWYDEALGDFLESEKKNYQDFWIHQALANIFLYHRDPPDLAKAREYYLKLAKYAAPTAKNVAAKGYLYAAFVCYLQRDDESAITNATKSTELDPDYTEAFYNLAKFAAVAHQDAIMDNNLIVTIHRDRNYAKIAESDPDFQTNAHFSEFMTKLANAAKEESLVALTAREQSIVGHDFAFSIVESRTKKLMESAKTLLQDTFASNADAYLAYQRAKDQLSEANRLLANAPIAITVTREQTGTNFDERLLSIGIYADTRPLRTRLLKGIANKLKVGETYTCQTVPAPVWVVLRVHGTKFLEDFKDIAKGNIGNQTTFTFDALQNTNLVCGATGPLSSELYIRQAHSNETI